MKKYISDKLNNPKFEAIQSAKTTLKYLKEVRNNKLIQAIKQGKSNDMLKQIAINAVVDEIKLAILMKGYSGKIENFDVDLLKTLNDQPMPETPLSDDEFTRVLDAACGRLPQKKPAGHRRFPWERVAAAAAACLAVGLGSVNFAAPAVAEQLPVVGSLFSWLNRGGQDDYVSLQSEQLNKYAETVESTAETAD